MHIIISNIADGTSVPDIRRAFKLAVKTKIFERLGKVLLSRFLVERDAHFRLVRRKSQGRVVRYAWVAIDDDRFGRLFIESLNGYTVRGQVLDVRESYPRAPGRNRRGAREMQWEGVERRSGERREQDH